MLPPGLPRLHGAQPGGNRWESWAQEYVRVLGQLRQITANRGLRAAERVLTAPEAESKRLLPGPGGAGSWVCVSPTSAPSHMASPLCIHVSSSPERHPALFTHLQAPPGEVPCPAEPPISPSPASICVVAPLPSQQQKCALHWALLFESMRLWLIFSALLNVNSLRSNADD